MRNEYTVNEYMAQRATVNNRLAPTVGELRRAAASKPVAHQSFITRILRALFN